MHPILLHVRYVTDASPSPDPLGFVLEALRDPVTITALAVGAIIAIGAILAWARWRPLEETRLRVIERVRGYVEYVPWILRLSFGLVLIGSGITRVLFAPDVAPPEWPYLVLTALGFLLLLGFAVRAAALLGLAIYLAGLVFDPQLIEIWDVAGGLAAVAVVGPGRPSLDDLLRAAFPRGPGARVSTFTLHPGRYGDVVPLLVRVGLGGALLASGVIDKIVVYGQALDTVEKYRLTSVVPVSPDLWVIGAAAIETALGAAILAGILTRACAILAFIVLTLAVFGLPDDPVLAHVGLFGSASLLVILGAGRWSLDHVLLRRWDRGRLVESGSST